MARRPCSRSSSSMIDAFKAIQRAMSRQSRSAGGRVKSRRRPAFAARVVNAGFATDGGIDLGQQRGRKLHQRYSPQVSGGGITCQVADDAASKRDDGFTALRVALYKPVIDCIQLVL